MNQRKIKFFNLYILSCFFPMTSNTVLDASQPLEGLEKYQINTKLSVLLIVY